MQVEMFLGLACILVVVTFFVLPAGLSLFTRWLNARSRIAYQKQVQAYWNSLQVTQIADGRQFEHFVAHVLNKYGTRAFVTPGSGDQGVDVIAVTRGGTRIALQCKLYTSRVTNKAIQEVFAGMAFHQCSKAVVITNSSFTKSAEELAARTGVKLIGYSQMHAFERGSHWIFFDT